MTKLAVNMDTFVTASAPVAEVGEWYAERINGKVEVSFGREVHTLWAIRHDGNHVSILGFVGRYRTSTKAWRASVSLYNGSLHAYFGRDDRSGRFNKMQGISLEAATFFKM